MHTFTCCMQGYLCESDTHARSLTRAHTRSHTHTHTCTYTSPNPSTPTRPNTVYDSPLSPLPAEVSQLSSSFALQRLHPLRSLPSHRLRSFSRAPAVTRIWRIFFWPSAIGLRPEFRGIFFPRAPAHHFLKQNVIGRKIPPDASDRKQAQKRFCSAGV